VFELSSSYEPEYFSRARRNKVILKLDFSPESGSAAEQTSPPGIRRVTSRIHEIAFILPAWTGITP